MAARGRPGVPDSKSGLGGSLRSLEPNAGAPGRPGLPDGKPRLGGNLSFLLLLAWRNLARHRRRTVITMLALAFSIAVFIFMDSMLRGIDEESRRNLVWYETGSGRVVTRAQRDDLDRVALKHELVDYRRVASALADLGIAGTPRVSFTGELFFGEGSLPLRLVAIDPATDGSVFSAAGRTACRQRLPGAGHARPHPGRLDDR